MNTWRVIRTGAAGVEFSLCGFGCGRDLFHVYVRLGLVTLYLSAYRLDRMLAMWNAARKALKAQHDTDGVDIHR